MSVGGVDPNSGLSVGRLNFSAVRNTLGPRHISKFGQAKPVMYAGLECVVEMMTNGRWQASPECRVGRDVSCKAISQRASTGVVD